MKKYNKNKFGETKMNEKEQEVMQLLYQSGGGITDTQIMELLGIDETTLYEIIKNLKKKGLLDTKKVEHTFMKPDLEEFDELELESRILTRICAEKMCLESEIVLKFNIDRDSLRKLLKKYQKEGLLEIRESVIKERDDFKIYATENLLEYIGRLFSLAESDDVIVEEKKKFIEHKHLTPCLFESFDGLRKAILSELKPKRHTELEFEKLLLENMRKKDDLSNISDKELTDLVTEELEYDPAIQSLKNNPELNEKLMEAFRPFSKYVDILTKEGKIKSYDDAEKLMQYFPEFNKLFKLIQGKKN